MEKVAPGKRILAIVSSWPSKEHPYLVYLYQGLVQQFPGMQLLLFRRAEDRDFADKLIGKREVDRVLAKCVYRFAFSRNPIDYFVLLVKIFRRIGASWSLVKSITKSGYSLRNAIGQLLYANAILGKEFDLIYVNALQTARHFRLRELFPNTPIIVSSRGQDFDWNPSRYDAVLRTVDHLHVLGSHLARQATKRGFVRSRITIIPPAILPVKTAGSNRGERESGCFTVVSAARLTWTKGYAYSLRAFEWLKKNIPPHLNCRYIILGDGPEREFLISEISRLNLVDSVMLKGWVDQVEVNDFLSHSDAYLLLSIEEGFNNSVMQAQNMGLPCVVADAGGLPENVVDGESGFVVPRYDFEAAGRRLLELALDEELRQSMGRIAKERMRRDFSLERQVAEYAKMFQKVNKKIS